MKTSNLSRAVLTAALVASLIVARPARGHHGQDFLVVQSYHVPGSLSAHAFGDFEWSRLDGGNGYEFQPGVMVGILPRTALEVTTLFEKSGAEAWRYSSVTPSVVLQLTPPDSKLPFRVAVSAGYEFADERGGAERHEEEHAEDGHGEEGHHGEQAEPGSHRHGDAGHHHGTSGFEGRLILETEAAGFRIGVNFIADTDDEGDAIFGYAGGVRYAFTSAIAAGVEAQGDFEGDGGHELIGALYFTPMSSLIVKVGAGFGLNENTDDFTLRTGVMWRF